MDRCDPSYEVPLFSPAFYQTIVRRKERCLERLRGNESPEEGRKQGRGRVCPAHSTKRGTTDRRRSQAEGRRASGGARNPQ